MKLQHKTLSAVRVLGMFGVLAAGCAPSKPEPTEEAAAPRTEKVGSVEQAVSNITPAWPANWIAIQRKGVGIADPIGDTQGGSGSSRDLVGDANNPTAYIQSDANNVFFRIRLGTDPQTAPNSKELTPFGWGCEILTDANPQTYEFIVAADGIVSPEVVSFAKNTSQTGKSLDDPADKADAPALANYAALADSVDGKAHARVIADAGTNIGNAGGKNAFIDLAIDRKDWEAAGITATTKFAVVCGSSSSAQALSADILSVDANRALSVVQSDRMVCTATGCVFEADADKDGIPDDVEGNGDTDMDGVLDKNDLDSDNDGIPDAIEGGATPVDTDGDLTPDYRDLDSDGDTLFDAAEAGHNQSHVNGVIAGPYGTNGLADAVETTADSGVINYTLRYTDPTQPKPDFQYTDDTDGDGISDKIEKGTTPANPPDSDGDGVADFEDLDSDNDGIPDADESAADTDKDSIPNYLDLDADADGIWDALEAGHDRKVDLGSGTIAGPYGDNGLCDAVETSPESGDANYPLRNTDAAGAPDFLDTDSDDDGISDKIERGPKPTPVDSDGDGLQDYRELDADNDGLPDKLEGADDLDADGVPNYLDLDADEDGLFDALEGGSGKPVNLDGTLPGPYGDNGLANSVETSADSGTIKYTPRNTDGDANPDYLDVDSDGDGISDAIEKGADPTKPVDTDGDGVPDYRDLDSDNDGITDAIEKGTDAEPVDTDADGTPDYRDRDSDGDGIYDAIESQSGATVSPMGTVAGPYGANGLADALETEPESGELKYDVAKTDGMTFDFQSQDSDGDGVPDAIEKGPGTLPVDTDGDGDPDYLDTDSDGDGISDAKETNGDGTLVDTDKDGTPDFRDLDSDGDTIPDSVEKDEDVDGDGVDNYRDLDSDGDKLSDTYEAGPDPTNPTDTDKNGTPDFLQANDDSDGDGIPDDVEFGENGPIDTDKDGTPDYLDTDTDGDGIPDKKEAGPNPKQPIDTDKDGTPDYQDLDSDDDGILDSKEAGADPTNPVDTDKDGTPDYQDLDSDGDGLLDETETAYDFDGDNLSNYLDLDSDNDCVMDLVEGTAGTQLDARYPSLDADDNCGADQRCDMTVGACVAAPKPEELTIEGGSAVSCAVAAPGSDSSGLLPVAGLALATVLVRRRRQGRVGRA